MARPPTQNNHRKIVIRWVLFMICLVSFGVGIYTTIAGLNTILGIINITVSFFGIPLSVLQIDRDAFSFLKNVKIGAVVIIVTIIIVSIGLNIYTYSSAFHPSLGLSPVDVPFTVYNDYGYADSHYSAAYKTDSIDTLPTSEIVDYNWGKNPHLGTTCIKVAFTPDKQYDWVGAEFLEPAENWGTVPSGGYNLVRAQQLTFWARGNAGGESVQFFMGGAGYNGDEPDSHAPYRDSSPQVLIKGARISLTTQWQKETIPLTGVDLSRVVDGFGWDVEAPYNPHGATFYIDDIEYS